MAEAKTQCAACGAEILVSTAERTGGLCRPCASGTRRQIEAGRRRAQHDKAFRASAVWQFWMRLVASDFTALRPSERVYLAVNELRGSVLINGGFHAYFSNIRGAFVGRRRGPQDAQRSQVAGTPEGGETAADGWDTGWICGEFETHRRA